MRVLPALVLAALLAAAPARAATLDFAFTFTNTLFGGGTVTGVVRGLADNGLSNATSVEVTGNTDGFGLGEYNDQPDFNVWQVATGQLVSFLFEVFGAANSAPAVTCCTLQITSADGGSAGLSQNPSGGSSTAAAGLTFRRIEASAVPAPSAALVLACALGLAGLARRWHPAT